MEPWVSEDRLLSASQPDDFEVDLVFLSCTAVCSAVSNVNMPRAFALTLNSDIKNKTVLTKANKAQKDQVKWHTKGILVPIASL